MKTPTTGKTAGELMASGRKWVYMIPATGFAPGLGWRPAIVFEDEPGLYFVGHSEKMPWYWGMTRAEADERAKEQNRRLGVSDEEAARIVLSFVRTLFKRRAPTRKPKPKQAKPETTRADSGERLASRLEKRRYEPR